MYFTVTRKAQEEAVTQVLVEAGEYCLLFARGFVDLSAFSSRKWAH